MLTGRLFTPNILTILAAFPDAMSNLQPLGESHRSQVFSSNRAAYVMSGAIFGFAIGVGMVMLAGLEAGLAALRFVAAGGSDF